MAECPEAPEAAGQRRDREEVISIYETTSIFIIYRSSHHTQVVSMQASLKWAVLVKRNTQQDGDGAVPFSEMDSYSTQQ